MNRRAMTAAVTAVIAMGGLLVAAPNSGAAPSARPAISGLSTYYGPTAGGPTITVRGSAFRHVARVLFGTTAGRHVHVASSSKLTVQLPKHSAGRVNVRVEVAGSGATTESKHDNADTFIYFAPPSPARRPSSTSTATSVTLRWLPPREQDRAAVGLTGVLIRRLPGASAPTSPTAGQLVADVKKPTTTVTDTHLAAGTEYSYALFAHDAYGHYARATHVLAHTLTTAEAADKWSGPTQPFGTQPSNDGVSELSCAANSFCLAIDSMGDVEEYESGHWSAGPAIHGSIYALSCTSATFCMELDNEGSERVFNGSTWSAKVVVPDDDEDVTDLSCASSTFCLAMDDDAGESATWNGSTWAGSGFANLDLGDTELSGLSCAAPSTCVAVADYITDQSTSVSDTFTGTRWATTSLVVSDTGVLFVSCVSPTFCVTPGAGGVFTYNGSRWSTGHDIGIGYSYVSCGSPTTCVAIGQRTASVFDGTTWSTPSAIAPKATELDDVACAADGFCLAFANGLNAYTRT